MEGSVLKAVVAGTSTGTLTAKLAGTGTGGGTVRMAEISLPAANWAGEAPLHTQVVPLPGVTRYSKIDLQPSAEQLQMFHEMDLALLAENENGVVTVYALGDRPGEDCTLQATVTEVRE